MHVRCARHARSCTGVPVKQTLPAIREPIPGPNSRALTERLRMAECPEVTDLRDPPPFWERGLGSNVFDADGNRYVDLVSSFGAACLGHAHPELAEVSAEQSGTLLHGMGDVFPTQRKLELLEALQARLPGDLGQVILSSSGSDAVESALKTAMCATGRGAFIAFEGAYHGLGFGALSVTHRRHFREPFQARLAGATHFVPYGDSSALEGLLAAGDIAAIVVEPIQGRGGLRTPPSGFLNALREAADAHGSLLIFDEVFTGWGRSGRWLCCERYGVLPDLVAIGKALGGGYPISACAGRHEVMQAWGESQGEAIHTSTHLGNPLGCALALKVIEIIERDGLLARNWELGRESLERLRSGLAGVAGVRDVRGCGLMLGVELSSAQHAYDATRRALERGWIWLPSGEHGNVIYLCPAYNIESELLQAGIEMLIDLVAAP